MTSMVSDTLCKTNNSPTDELAICPFLGELIKMRSYVATKYLATFCKY